MKKLFSTLALAVFGVLSMSAQMIAYSVSANVAAEPGEPTVIDLQGTVGSDLSGLMIDAEGNMEFNSVEDAKGFPIGFEFRYNGQKMTHFLIGSDLEIQLSPTETISTEIHKNMITGFTTEGIHDVIGMFPREGVYGLDNTQISYWLEGNEGNRVLCIEYKDIDFGNGGGWGTNGEFCGADATIQYRLYEQSGNIEMKVKGFEPTDPGRYNFFRMGILGDSNDFIQVHAWDGSVVSASDNSISYNADNYPADGMVYTFQAPEPCVAPTASGSGLELTSTSDQISGTFVAGDGDHYIVLATTDDQLSEMPVDQTKYHVGDVIGNATVIAIVEGNEFSGATGMAQGTYNVFVIAFNSLCMDGPLYCADVLSNSIALKPGAPASLVVANADRDFMTLKAEDCGSQMVIAITDVQEFNQYDQALGVGLFGTPTGDYQVGDEIAGGGKVVYVGNTNDAISVNELEAGKVYFFRAWSTDGNGGYSSQWIDINALTAAELPWEPVLEGAAPSEPPLGWTTNVSDDFYWAVEDYNDIYIYNTVNFVDGMAETWLLGPDVYLNEGSNWLSIEIGANSIPVRWADDWTMGDDDEIAVQVSTDGVEFKSILTLNKDNMPEFTDEETGETVNIWKNGEFVPFMVNFSEYAGQKVKVRLYVKRATKGDVNFKNMKLEGTVYGIVGTIPGMTWEDDVIMSQSADNENIYTVTVNVDVPEVPETAYEYKLRANKSWDGYQIPTTGNYEWLPTEAGTYTLVFTADLQNNSLTLSVQRPFEVYFDNKGNWSEVYAYTFTYDEATGTTTEYSGAWPGTKVETYSGWGMNRTWTYSFAAEGQPQYIIWNNGGGNEWEEADQTPDLLFVNGKKYSYFPEITSVQLPGTYNGWSAPDMEAGPYANQWNVTIEPKEDTEFKLVVNGEWIGFSDVTIEAPEGWVVEGSENDNMKLMHSVAQKPAYFVVAYWMSPSNDIKSGWLIGIEEGEPVTPTSINTANGNRPEGIYNLNGVRLNEKQRGVNIINGNKVVVK